MEVRARHISPTDRQARKKCKQADKPPLFGMFAISLLLRVNFETVLGGERVATGV